MKRSAICLLTLISLSAFAYGSSPENLALNKPYILEPAPGYQHCTDAGDITQLTDGMYTEGYFWTQAGTVGWFGASPVIITLDLGEVKPIRGLSFSTAAGVAGVEWPRAIRILVADEDRLFHEIGDLCELDGVNGPLQMEGYGLRRFRTEALQTHGRFVALVVEMTPFTFVDEIEVYAGEPAWTDAPLPGTPIADIKEYLVTMRVRDAIGKRLRDDIESIRELVNTSVPETGRAEIITELDALAGDAKVALDNPPADFRAVLPLNPLHERILATQARAWRAAGLSPLTLWQTDSVWDPLPHIALPPSDRSARIEMRMMSNEYRAAAFCISNAGEADADFQLRVEGLPGGANPAYLTVHEVAWTDTFKGVPVAAALPEALREGEAWRVTAATGLTRQVWLTFHPVDLPEGRYEGRLTLTSGAISHAVPLVLQVYPLRFPDKPTLHCGGWDYVNSGGAYGITVENRKPFIEHLRAHFVDSPWATSGVIPAATFENGVFKPGDTAAFDEWLELWPGAARYCIFAAVSDHIGPHKIGDAGFDPAVQAWTQSLASHAREKGVAPENVYLLLVDEPYENAQDAIILAWAKAIRAANTGLQIWEDPIYQDMSLANQDMVAACHVLCPNRQIFESQGVSYQEYFAARQQEGIRLEFYSCSGPARMLDAYYYYRLQPWLCWKWNADASYYWAFGDNGKYSTWNEYLGTRPAYTPLFIEDTTVTAAKEMEAIREGIEDFEYLVMLRKAVNDAEARGVPGAALEPARALLTGAAPRVLESSAGPIQWSHERKRTEADVVRVEILETLSALQ